MIIPNFRDPEDESEFDEACDMNDQMRENEILWRDRASDCEDFSRSDEDGWYYSDED